MAAIADRELRLQVDEQSGQVRAVMLAGSDGACEFQAFAAPRNGDLWSTVRPQIAEDMSRRGGQATEREGRWGTELVCQMPVKRPDGTEAIQPSRIIGINGARWMLRASFLGDDAGAMWVRVDGSAASLWATSVIVPQWGATLTVTSTDGSLLRSVAADPDENSYARQLEHLVTVLGDGSPSILDARRGVGTMRVVDETSSALEKVKSSSKAAPAPPKRRKR